MFGRKRQLAIAMDALRYYGADTTWKRRGKNDDYQPAPFTTDHGKQARAAIDKIRDDQARSFLSRIGDAFKSRPVQLGEFHPPRAVTVPKSNRRVVRAFKQAQAEVAAIDQRHERERAA